MDQIQVSAWSDGKGAFGFRFQKEYLSKLQSLKDITLILSNNDEILVSKPNLDKKIDDKNSELINKEIRIFFEKIKIVENGEKKWEEETPKFNLEFSRNSNIIVVTKVK